MVSLTENNSSSRLMFLGSAFRGTQEQMGNEVSLTENYSSSRLMFLDSAFRGTQEQKE